MRRKFLAHRLLGLAFGSLVFVTPVNAQPATDADFAATAQVVGPAIVMVGAPNGGYITGFDARKGEYCDLVKTGIIDPLKVVRSALQNAASVSMLLLTSDALVADMPKDEKGKKSGGDGHEDMY